MFFYRLLSSTALLAYSPYALLRALLGRRRLGDLPGRLGWRSFPDLSGGVWIHAVSVGEVGVARSLLSAFAGKAPGRPMGLSATTAAGRKLAQSLASEAVPVFAFPLDLRGPVERALSGVRPGLVLLTETEIWPLFLERAAARGIPVALVNGRVSPRSFARYFLVRRWLAASLGRVALFAMQSPEDAERIVALGVPPERVRMTGNLKYDTPEAPPFLDAARLRAAAAGRPVFVAASTAQGEEEIVLRAWRNLDPRPFLVLAPRRPERFDAVAALIERSGFSVLRRSSPDDCRPSTVDSVYLLDSIGELASVYREARVALIGGSFVRRGGHNPIEAWAAGVPVLAGPHTENFRQIMADGQERGFARRVESKRALARQLTSLLDAEGGATEAGERARRFVAANRGAAGRTVELLLPLLEPRARRRAVP
ncbi:MAG: 3-deoxy-D-manno-octulosonic acid transferase [Thermoanaerobaculia bacterium]